MLTSLLMNSLWSTSDSSKLGMKIKGALKRGVGQEEWYQLRLVNRRSPPVEISDLCFMIARYNLFVDLCRIMKNNYLDTRSPLTLRSRRKEIINDVKWLLDKSDKVQSLLLLLPTKLIWDNILTWWLTNDQFSTCGGSQTGKSRLGWKHKNSQFRFALVSCLASALFVSINWGKMRKPN